MQGGAVGAEPGGEDDRGLHGQEDGQGGEGHPDQSQGEALAGLPGPGQLPQHDGAGADLDQAVEPEPGQGDRAGGDGGDGEDDDADEVPRQSRPLEGPASLQQDSLNVPARGGQQYSSPRPSTPTVSRRPR